MKPRNKYHAQPTMLYGIRFASKREARRYGELKLLEKAGKIKNLRRQVPYALTIQTKYLADFCYEENGLLVVEDSKGFATREFKRKRKAMKQQYGIEVKTT